jgi:NDP-sugar pyrophosphorylase family protein
MTGVLNNTSLFGGVIAAGDGTRLKADGYRVSKPMAEVGGRPLIGHTLDRFRAVGVRRVTVIINEASEDCGCWLREYGRAFDLEIVVRTTPSSYASFEIVAERLAGAAALITTVDSILPVEDFSFFVSAAAQFPKDGIVLGLTAHVDDEKPLWATLDSADGRILELGGPSGSHVTAGLYWLPASRVARPDRDFRRLRDYLKWLLDSGARVYGVPLPIVFDIDRAADIEAAEKLAGFGARRVTAYE